MSDKPIFFSIADKFLDFIKDSELVIHNAKFDLGFLNYELDLASKKNLLDFNIIDTLSLARKIFPGASNNLDALCRRYNINLTKREETRSIIRCRVISRCFS